MGNDMGLEERSMIRNWRQTALVGLLVLTILMSGCTPKIKADISSYGDDSILVKGVLEEDFYVTPNELAKLDLVTATAQNKKDGTVKAIGPTMDTFLAQYDKKPADFTKVVLRARDGFIRELKLPFDYLLVMSIADGHGNVALNDDQYPLRFVVPDDNRGKGIRMVIEMEFFTE